MLGWFAETTVVVAVLAAVALIAGRRGRIGPAARHMLWLVALIRLLIPPPVSWPWSLSLPATRDVALDVLASLHAAAADAPEAPGRGSPPIPRPEEGSERAGATAGHDRIRGGTTARVVARSASPPAPDVARPISHDETAIGRWAIAAWLAVSLLVALGQVARIARFRRRLRTAVPAPEWLVAEVDRIGERIDVRSPGVWVAPQLDSPLIWCLGPPRLFLPSRLVEELDADGWRGILAHELAHLRRGDPWVKRLELIAGWLWWWNPLYWLIRRRLDIEAELACDAWVVSTLPEDRVPYAEVLLRIGASLSPARSPSPALGVSGAGRFFERRLTMILRDRVPCRPSGASLLVAGLLALLSLPSWTSAEPAPSADDRLVAPVVIAAIDPLEATTQDDDEPTPESDPEKEVEALGKEMEAKFGPGSDFVKKMEALGKEMEAKFGPGSDFAKEMESKFGAGSDFVKEMEKVGEKVRKEEAKRLTEPLESPDTVREEGSTGPRTTPDAAAAAQALELARERVRSAERMRELGSISEAQLEEDRRLLQEAESRMRQAERDAAEPEADRGERDQRIRQIEETIRELMDELRSLQGDEGGRRTDPGRSSDDGSFSSHIGSRS